MNRQKGITLIALVITVIVMLILAGVAISMTIGENGIFRKASEAKEIHNEQVAREKLELVLDDLTLDKYRVNEYNSEQYIDDKMAAEEIVIVGNITIVDDWKFEIDREQLIIVDKLGKGEENGQIGITARGEVSSDYVKATIQVEIAYERTISEIIINGKRVEVPIPENGVYSVTQEVDENGNYSIVVKDEEGNYRIGNVRITEITEDMEIWNKADMQAFRDKVNSGRTFDGRTVQVKAEIDLEGTEEDKWIPIADYANNNQLTFKGTFEGNDFTIKNLYINSTNYHQGLFGINEGNIQNVKLTGRIVTTGDRVGGIVGENRNRILHCVNYAYVQGRDDVAGITGIIEIGASVEKCGNQNEIYSTNGQVGGITGQALGTIKECYNTGYIHAGNQTAGGICGYKKTGIMYNCYNTANVSAVGRYVGGINGAAGLGGYATSYTYNCYNTGEITGSEGINGITGSGNVNGGSAADINCYTIRLIPATVDVLNKGEYSEQVWIEDIGINGGHPILKWQVEEL